MQVLFFIFQNFFLPRPGRAAPEYPGGCSLPVKQQERAQAMVRVLAAAPALLPQSQPQLFPQPQLLPQPQPQPHPQLFPQPLFEPQPQQKMMIRIRMIHRQLLPPQPLLQHIDNYLLSEMETVLRSQSILCRRCLDVRPGWERFFIFSLGIFRRFPAPNGKRRLTT